MKRALLAAAVFLSANALCGAGELALTPAGYRQLALQDNPGLRQARLAARAADQAEKAAFTNYFPKLSASGMAANTNILPDSALSIPILSAMAPIADEKRDYAFSEVTILQPLFAGGRIYNGNRLARAGRDAAQQQLRLKEQEVIAGAEKRYRALKVLAEKKKTLAAYATLLDDLGAQVGQAFAGGLVTKTDVLRVGLRKAEVALNRATLDKSAALAEEDFKLYAAIPLDSTVTLQDAGEPMSEPSEKPEDLRAALSGRPEYKLLETGARAARLQTELKRGEYLPAVAIGAALYRVDYFNSGDDLRYQNSAAFGLVSVPLNWWEASHSIKEMTLKQAAAQERLEEMSDNLLLDLKSRLKDYQDAYSRGKLAELAVEESAANRSEMEDGYKNGTEKLSDLLEALALEQQSKDGLEEARAAYFEKRAEFLLAAGEFSYK